MTKVNTDKQTMTLSSKSWRSYFPHLRRLPEEDECLYSEDTNSSATTEAVSYTHLDVYKRQGVVLCDRVRTRLLRR